MSRSAEQRIANILQSIDRCTRYADALGSVDQNLTDMAEDAIERNLQIIGEAASHLPSAVTEALPDIAWPQIRGFRNILVHQYFGVDLDTVRDVIHTHLPQLAAALRSHVEKY